MVLTVTLKIKVEKVFLRKFHLRMPTTKVILTVVLVVQYLIRDMSSVKTVISTITLLNVVVQFLMQDTSNIKAAYLKITMQVKKVMIFAV